MTRRILVTSLVVAISAFAGCSAPQQVEKGPEPAPRSIGLVEHRGRIYRMENLMDPAYRAKSGDPFVRGFAEENNIAIEWAGLNHASDKLLLREKEMPFE